MSDVHATVIERIVVVPGRHTYSQQRLAQQLVAALSAAPDSRSVCQLAGFVAERSEIRQRHLEVSLDDLAESRSWFLTVNEATCSLAERAIVEAFAPTPGGTSECDALVCVSSTHGGFPSLTRRLQQKLGFRDDALCLDLTGLGCAGPTQGLDLAHRLLADRRIRRVCLVCVDAMGTYGASRRFRSTPNMSQVVAHSLASDAAAAVVLGREPTDQAVFRFGTARLQTRLWKDSLDDNDLTTSPDDQPLLAVGPAIRDRFLDELRPFFDAWGDRPQLIHPGGAALMGRLAAARPELAETIDVSTSVLTEHGNVGSPSVLFVLRAALDRGLTITPELRLVALGPGIVSTVLTLNDVQMFGEGR